MSWGSTWDTTQLVQPKPPTEDELKLIENAKKDFKQDYAWESNAVLNFEYDYKFANGDFSVVTQVILQEIKQLTASTPAAENLTEEPKKVGGINFDPTLLNLQIKRDGSGVPLPLPQQNIENINKNDWFGYC